MGTVAARETWYDWGRTSAVDRGGKIESGAISGGGGRMAAVARGVGS
jgi:hypothetical protein